jgi:Uma2 family endonuclease
MPDDIEIDTSKVWTHDDLIAMGDTEDGRKYEIFDGELVVTSSPSLWHQAVLKRLFLAFHELEKQKIARVYFAPLDVVLSKTRVVQPDLLVIRSDRKEAFGKWVTAPPDLAIEVLSPSNRHHDRVRKRRAYARYGIREYWIVDPDERTIEVLEQIEGGLSYRSVGWFANGDRARSVTFELEVELDPLFSDE